MVIEYRESSSAIPETNRNPEADSMDPREAINDKIPMPVTFSNLCQIEEDCDKYKIGDYWFGTVRISCSGIPDIYINDESGAAPVAGEQGGNAYQIAKIVIATSREVQMASHQEMNTAEDNEQNIPNQEDQRTPAPPMNTIMATEIVAPSELQSTSRQEMGRAGDEEQKNSRCLALATMMTYTVKDFYSSESDDFCSTGDDEPGAQNPENLQLNKENTPLPDTASIAGPSNAGNAFQVPKIVIAPPKNRQVTPKGGPSNKSILVADRPALNERSAEKNAAAKQKIDSDEESSSSDSSNSSQTSGSSSSSLSSSSPPRPPALPRPFTCGQCSYASTRLANLQSHRLTHTGQKPFRCNQCPYASAEGGNLKRHMRTHTGEKPFKCTNVVCSKTFADRTSLRDHLSTHTGETPFKCNLCSYASTQNSNLKRHMGTHNKNKK
ncbi:zinc-finger double domain-containing protein [Ditylenchus destructor]|uniref:Zinc-finger double domain-containing protein n=1 Tax=Ditylenchus destructor TaxID=166010 RepID=A0AAD4N0V8_9BILA|nr:zinc-finger double domain-containing protein [Ditylenchus destructor]